MPRTITDPEVRALYEQRMAEQPHRTWTPERRAELRVQVEQEITRQREARHRVTA
jgi:hypothetical protein